MGTIARAQLLLGLIVAAGCSPASSTNTADAVEPAHPAEPAAGGAVCGRLPSEPVEPMEWLQGDSRECDQIQTTWANVPHADRVCADAADCTIIWGHGHCGHLLLNRDAAARPEYENVPCGDPAAGACPGEEVPVECVQGCCGGPRT